MLSKDLDCLMFVTKCNFYFPGVYMIKLSVNNEIICVFNKHHILFPTLFRSPMEHRVFGGGGGEQT